MGCHSDTPPLRRLTHPKKHHDPAWAFSGCPPSTWARNIITPFCRVQPRGGVKKGHVSTSFFKSTCCWLLSAGLKWRHCPRPLPSKKKGLAQGQPLFFMRGSSWFWWGPHHPIPGLNLAVRPQTSSPLPPGSRFAMSLGWCRANLNFITEMDSARKPRAGGATKGAAWAEEPTQKAKGREHKPSTPFWASLAHTRRAEESSGLSSPSHKRPPAKLQANCTPRPKKALCIVPPAVSLLLPFCSPSFFPPCHPPLWPVPFAPRPPAFGQ